MILIKLAFVYLLGLDLLNLIKKNLNELLPHVHCSINIKRHIWNLRNYCGCSFASPRIFCWSLYLNLNFAVNQLDRNLIWLSDFRRVLLNYFCNQFHSFRCGIKIPSFFLYVFFYCLPHRKHPCLIYLSPCEPHKWINLLVVIFFQILKSTVLIVFKLSEVFYVWRHTLFWYAI